MPVATTTHKPICNRLALLEKKKLLDEQRASLKISKGQSLRAAPGKGFQLKAMKEATRSSTAPLEKVTENAIDSLDTEDETGDHANEENLNQDALDRHEIREGGRIELACWEDLLDEVAI